jgi:predicted dinucleotide-binding enzyme
MRYAIVGFGKIGQALAHAFARKNVNVTVASRRPPEALAPQARAIGPTVVAKSLKEALEADTIILAIPFGEHREVAKTLPNWNGKTVIDAMNSFPVAPEELDGLPSSAFAARSFPGAKFVKGFNHLVAATLATDPVVEGGYRVVFLSSDEEDAIARVADLAKQLGFAPVKLGKLNEGGALVHARGRVWGPLIFQDLFKKQQ